MNILVVDDSPVHRDAAQAQLADHTLTVVGGYDEAEVEILCNGPSYDAVLVDLLMPASAKQQGREGMQHVGRQMPLGIFLALLAAKRDTPLIAVFTDADHHEHPASACFDAFNPNGETRPSPFVVKKSKMLLSNTRRWIKAFYCDDLARAMDWDEYFKDEARAEAITIRAKDWREPLDYLMRA
jgi:CheY-like chemotaxis protein